MKIYFDSSGFIKYFGEEKGTEKIIKIVEETEKNQDLLLSSSLLIPEIIGGFDKWYRQKLITKSDFEKLVKVFLDILIKLVEDGTMKFILLENYQVINNMKVLIKHHFGGSDLIHLNSAIASDCDLFVASDKQLCNGTKSVKLEALNPET